MKSILFVLLLTCITCQGAVIYVDGDAQGAGDGSSWDDAFNHLQDALGQAVSGDEIRIAEGIYKPDEDIANPDGTGNREKYFRIQEGVKLLGGFSGSGNQLPNQRDIGTYQSVLSGDLNGDDGPDFINRSDNSNVVLRCNNCTLETVIDGLVITGGYRTSWHGGGLWNEYSSPTIIQCVFIDNASGYGGGITNRYECSPVIMNCLFVRNKAYMHGAGIDNVWGSSPVVDNCVFIQNNARLHGGAISNDQSCSPTVINCTISGNTTEGIGGGLCNIANSNPKVVNSIIWGNSDSEGSSFISQFSGGDTSLISYSCIQGWDPSYGGIGNLAIDPMLDTDRYHLLLESPCINAGDPSYAFDLTEIDIDGEYRVMNDRIDIGADELSVSGITSIAWMIRNVLENKTNASELLLGALSEEKKVMSEFEEYLLEGDFSDLDRTEAIKAKSTVKAALMYEKIASRMLVKSMKELEDALALLANNNIQTNKGVPVFHDHKKFDYEIMMADINGDQRVDFTDLQLLGGYWLKTYEFQE